MNDVLTAAYSGQEFCTDGSAVEGLPKYGYEYNEMGCDKVIKYGKAYYESWICTRSLGHLGEHRASNGSVLLARWCTSAVDVDD